MLHSVLLFVSTFFIFLTLLPSPVYAYVDGTQYHATVTIDNSAGSALTDYQVTLNIDTGALVTGGFLQADCDDLRFLDSNQSTALPYWIESGCNTSSTKIWVKVPSIAGTSSKTIHMYYGNVAASIGASGASTFDFFDDFNSFNSSVWTATGAYSVGSSAITVTTGSVYTQSTVNAQPNTMVESRIAWGASGAHAGMQIANHQGTYAGNTTAAKLAYIFVAGSDAVLTSLADGTTATYNLAVASNMNEPPYPPYNNLVISQGTYYIMGEAVTNSKIYTYKNYQRSFDVNGTWSGNYFLWLGYFRGSLAGTTDGTNVTVDWTRVRKYAATEPALTVTYENVIPSAPTLSYGLIGNSKIELHWTAPTQGASITDYVIEYRTGADAFAPFADGTSNSLFATVTGLTNSTVYDFRVSATNSEGTGAVSNVLSFTPTSATLHGVLFSGQSYAVGYTGGPPLSTAQPYSNIKLNSGHTAFVPLVEDNTTNVGFAGSVESPMSALANYITSESAGTAYQLALLNNAVPGNAYSQLKKTTTPYNNGMSYITTAKTLADGLGRTFKVEAIVNMHGPADRGNVASYPSYLYEWQTDYTTDISAITGQTGEIPMFIDQSSNLTPYGDTTVPLAIAQLEAAENDENIFLVGPKYQLTYNPSDWIHLANTGYYWWGEYYAKALKRVLIDNDTNINVRPLEVVRNGAVISARFTVPVAPLAFDTTNVLSKANYGFEFYDDSGSTPAISSVALDGSDTVRVTLASTPSGATQKLRYAYTGTANAQPGAQIAGSTRGNLRDSDPSVGRTGNKLYNWSVHFDKTVTADSVAPTPTSVAANTTSSSAEVSWTTSESSSSRVEYGPSNSYGTTTSETDISPRVGSHTVSLSSLQPCTRYYYRVKSEDLAANVGTSAAGTFETTGCAGSASIEGVAIGSATTASGGTAELLLSGSGVNVEAPAAFHGADATLQIKKLTASTALTTIGLPSGRSTIGVSVYDLKALTGPTTVVSSFSAPITLTFHYTDEEVAGYTESSIVAYRHDGSSWSALSDCVVDTTANTATCTTSAFSTFGIFGVITSTPTPTSVPTTGPTSTPTQSSSASSTSSQNGSSATVCSDLEPGQKPPNIWKINTVLSDTVRLYFDGGDDPYSHFSLRFGTESGIYKYGLTNIGDNNTRVFDVRFLQSGVTYYFSLQGVNGCAAGKWSNEAIIKVGTASGLVGSKVTTAKNTPTNVSAQKTSTCTKEYVVKKGDSLWGISSNLLGNGFRYVDLIKQNSSKYPRIKGKSIDEGWKLSIPTSGCATKVNAAKLTPTKSPPKKIKTKK